MNYNINNFKTLPDKLSPLSFFDFFLDNEKCNRFIESLYPRGLGFIKEENGSYSFFINTAYYNNYEMIDSVEEYRGSIYNDLESILLFYICEIDVLLKNRLMGLLYDSRKDDTKYLKTFVNQIDKILIKIKVVKDAEVYGLVKEALIKIRSLACQYLKMDDEIESRPLLNQEHIDFEVQFSYLLGEIKPSFIEKLFKILDWYDLVDLDRNTLEDLNNVFFSLTPRNIDSQIILTGKKSKITAFFYALNNSFETLTLKKIEQSEAFFFKSTKKDEEYSLLTENKLNRINNYNSDKIEYLNYLKIFEEEIQK